jgi:hypothetical protein
MYPRPDLTFQKVSVQDEGQTYFLYYIFSKNTKIC